MFKFLSKRTLFDIAILSIKNYPMNVYVGLFLNTVLGINSKYHDWNYKRGIARIEKEWVMLPINDQGKPDWEFMDIYMYIYIARGWLKKQESKKLSNEWQPTSRLDKSTQQTRFYHLLPTNL